MRGQEKSAGELLHEEAAQAKALGVSQPLGGGPSQWGAEGGRGWVNKGWKSSRRQTCEVLWRWVFVSNAAGVALCLSDGWGPGVCWAHQKCTARSRQPSVQRTFKNTCRKACDAFMRSRINFHPTRSKYRTAPASQRAP